MPLTDGAEPVSENDTFQRIGVGIGDYVVRSNRATRTYLVGHDWNREGPISTTLPVASDRIASFRGQDSPPLFDYVAPEALSRLLDRKQKADPPRVGRRSTSTYVDLVVPVHGEGQITVQPLATGYGNGAVET